MPVKPTKGIYTGVMAVKKVTDHTVNYLLYDVAGDPIGQMSIWHRNVTDDFEKMGKKGRIRRPVATQLPKRYCWDIDPGEGA